MLSEYLKTRFFSKKEKGILVEVGSAGPDFLSQSKYFKDLGWRCICVEPNPKFAQMHREVGNEIYEYACSDFESDDVDFYLIDFSDRSDSNLTFESFSSLGLDKLSHTSGFNSKPSPTSIKVKSRKLDTILNEADVSKIDCLIVDVEGWEIEVLKGFSSEKYKPEVIVLECLEQESMYHEYMSSIGYEVDSFDTTTGPNYVYCKKKVS